MAIPSGLSTQLGIIDETVYGTPVAVTRFYEFTNESLKFTQDRIESSALRSGTRLQRSDRWVLGKRSVAGSVEMEMQTKSMGLWFKHALGNCVTAQPSAGPDPTVFTHTFTVGDYPVGLTVQVGRTDVTGVTRAFTYHGCKINEWGITAAVDEIVKCSFGLVGEDEDTITTLATATYPASSALFTFINGSFTVGGTALPVKSCEISGKNALDEGRYFLGSGLRKEPLENGFREITGKIAPEFSDLTAYNRFVTGTEAALVMTFEGAIISTTLKYSMVITANVRFDGETPTVGGTDVLQNPMNFKVVGDTPASAFTMVYQTTDTLP